MSVTFSSWPSDYCLSPMQSGFSPHHVRWFMVTWPCDYKTLETLLCAPTLAPTHYQKSIIIKLLENRHILGTDTCSLWEPWGFSDTWTSRPQLIILLRKAYAWFWPVSQGFSKKILVCKLWKIALSEATKIFFPNNILWDLRLLILSDNFLKCPSLLGKLHIPQKSRFFFNGFQLIGKCTSKITIVHY